MAVRSLRRAIALASTFVAACGPFHRGNGVPDAVVIFNNQSLSQANVYAVWAGGEQVRIGTVFGGRTEKLRVPGSITSTGTDISIVARLFASTRVPRTGPIHLAPGDTIEVTLPSDERILTVLPPRSP